MKNIFLKSFVPLTITMLLILTFLSECSKDENKYKYPMGIFPDTVLNLTGLNSAFDDYNSTISEVTGSLPIVFSSNRSSSGAQFDLEQGIITFTFDKASGHFDISSQITDDDYYRNLIAKAKTPLDDLGPYLTYSSYDGMEYLILSSENADGNLDLRYCLNTPRYGSVLPPIYGPYPIKLMNTSSDDGYLTFDLNLDSAYFMSNIDGNFDIYVKSCPSGTNLSTWFNSDYSPSAKVDNINSSSDDKCPMVYNKLMVFTSDRPGGYGGFDLYYSVFRNGNWSEPMNFGPRINSSSDEYRPLIGFHSDFTNLYLIFSSNRPGGNGGYDLYFTGIDNPE